MAEIKRTTGRGRFQDLTGRVFGRLTVVREERVHKSNVVWECLCECGTTAHVTTHNLTTETTRSCGCLKRTHLLGNTRRKTHGGRRTPEYESWRRMKKCCFCPNTKAYPHYGGRGITVCAGWRDSFEAFLADVGKKPSPRLTIDRIANDGNYSCGKCEECRANGWPANCRWATMTEQHRNKRNNRMMTHGGLTLTLPEWAERTGISTNVLSLRVHAGWSDADALTRPVRKLPPRKQRKAPERPEPSA